MTAAAKTPQQWVQVLPGVTAAVYTACGEAPAFLADARADGAFVVDRCCEGRVEWAFTDGGALSLSGGEAALWPLRRKTARCWLPLGRVRGVRFLVEPDAAPALKTLGQEALGRPLSLLPFTERVQTGLWMLRRETVEKLGCPVPPPGAQTAWYRLYFMAMALYLQTQPDVPATARPRLSREQARRVREARGYLIDHLERQVTMAELAGRSHLSATFLKSGFKALYGEPMGSYMRRFRIQQARELLCTSTLTVAQVAQAVGYESPSRFAAVFRRLQGCTPLEARRSAADGEE